MSIHFVYFEGNDFSSVSHSILEVNVAFESMDSLKLCVNISSQEVTSLISDRIEQNCH